MNDVVTKEERLLKGDSMLKAIDLSIKLLEGKEIDENEFPKLHSREELLKIYQAFKKAILLLENIIV